MDQASLLSALTIFLLSAGVDVCSPEPLHTLCLQRITTAMDAKEPQVSPTATPAAAQWLFVEVQLLISDEGWSMMMRISLDPHQTGTEQDELMWRCYCPTVSSTPIRGTSCWRSLCCRGYLQAGWFC